MFGHAVRAFYRDVFDKHAATFESLGVSPDNGIGDVYAKIRRLPDGQRAAIEADLQAVYATRPALAMVDSSKGITNLHVPSDVIIDASMPAAIRASGQMWGPDGKLHDTKALIPDRCYASVYQAVIDDCKAHGAFDVASMGTVSNVGLMAQAAEEYGSHDKTFEVRAAGRVHVVDHSGRVVFEHPVEAGDIWRMFSRKACYCFVRPKRKYLEVCFFVGRKITAPQITRAIPASRVKVAHMVRVRHRDESRPRSPTGCAKPTKLQMR